MLRNLILFWSMFVFSCLGAFGQISVNSKRIAGTIRDAETGDPIVSASIRTLHHSAGTASDGSGHFEIDITDLQADTLLVSHVGYNNFRLAITDLRNTLELRIKLTKETIVLKEISVFSQFWLKRYPPEQLKEDYKKFCTLMEKVHTGLFEYVTEKEWSALKDSSQHLFNAPMTHAAFYQLIAWHVGMVRNARTRHGVTDSWYKKKQNIFPFNVRYIKGKLYITESLLVERPFPKGTEIIQINGKSPQEIKSIFWPFIPADGINETGRAAALDDYFPWYYSLFVEEAEDYNIKLKLPSGQETDYATPGFHSTFAALSFSQIWKRKRTALELQIYNDLNAAYFRIDDSHVFNDSLRIYFERMERNNVHSLVIDLRGEGGIRQMDHVAVLYSYLATKLFRIYDHIEVKSNDNTVFDRDFSFKPAYKSAQQVKSYLEGLVDSGNGYYVWQQKAFDEFIKPAKINFSGNVYLLVDGRTSATSSDFASLAARLENVTVIGEETGGGYRSYVGGAEFALVLPHSLIGIKIPTWKSVLAIEEDATQHGRGVRPDYEVKQTIDDFINDRDAAREFAWQLVRERK
jgi:hypothetical protein